MKKVDYRNQALKILPWVCGKCGRDFSGKNLRELTVHHKDHNYKNKARRWVVELAHSCFNRFRKLVPRYEKTDLSYLALNMLAAAMITLNKIMTIYR